MALPVVLWFNDRQRGVSVAQVVRDALEKDLGYEQALAGIVSSKDGDLSRRASDDEFQPEPYYERAPNLIATYADLGLGFVDASVLAVVERLHEPKLATLDRRHSPRCGPATSKALTLLPS
jgi:hypothetical protein